MTTYSLTLSAQHHDKLRQHLVRPDQCEHVAYILCSEAVAQTDPWDREKHRKFLAHEVIPVPDHQVVSSTPNLVTWQTTSFVAALKKAQANNQYVAIIHNHPNNMLDFSAQDTENERDLMELSCKRNGPNALMLSVIMTESGDLAGRVWLHPNPKGTSPLRMIRVIGETFKFNYPNRGNGQSAEAFHRQALAFGEGLNQDLKSLRVGIVGCGGTGSAVAMLLPRIGIGQIALFDNDIVDRTNLNRLHGARQTDADAMAPKVTAVARSITDLGLGVRVATFNSWVGNIACRDALRSCDILFGCTDDNEGRLFLNRFAYFYLTPLIDLGLAIDVSNSATPEIKCLDGRVSVIMPPYRCLACRGITDPRAAQMEGLRRKNPDEFEKHKAGAYVMGAGNPNPAVVTFTTEVATMAVNELIHRIQGFRGPNGAKSHRVRKFNLDVDFRPGTQPASSCRICDNKTIWGKGDVDPFLDRIE